MIFVSRNLSFDDGFYVVADNIHDCYVYLFKKERRFQTIIVLDHFLSFSKNWDKEMVQRESCLSQIENKSKSHLFLIGNIKTLRAFVLSVLMLKKEMTDFINDYKLIM